MSASSEQHKMRQLQTPLPSVTLQELERMNDEEFWNYARLRERTRPELSSYTEYIECHLASYTYLVAFQHLAEVVPPPYRLARLPHIPPWMAGIMVWRGAAIAVVNLDLYLCGARPIDTSWAAAEHMLLVASQGNTVVGLLVPALGSTSAIAPEHVVPLSSSRSFALTLDPTLVIGTYTEKPILNIPTLLPQLVQQIGMAKHHE